MTFDEYISLGYQPVPLKENLRPLISWKHLSKRSSPTPHLSNPTQPPSHTQQKTLPDTTPLALVTGRPSNVTVFDIDTPCTKTAKAFAEALYEHVLHTPTNHPPVTQTKSGGVHVWIARIPNLRNQTNIVYSTLIPPHIFTPPDDVPFQVDIRADGGLIVVPPSPNYSFLIPPIQSSSLPHATKEAQQTLLSKRIRPHISLSDAKKHSEWYEIFTSTSSGERNHNATKLIGLLKRRLSPHEYVLIPEILQLWNTHNVSPPLPQSELERTIKSIMRYHN